MKIIILILCCLILLASPTSVVYCEDNLMATNGYYNGHFIVEGVQSGKSSECAIAKAYVHGLFDALVVSGYKEKFLALYGTEATGDEIFEAIYLYYKNNPAQRDKPAIKVLLDGAK